MPQARSANKARPLVLPAGLDLEAGFALIARHCLRQIRANEAGLKFSSDPEFVHQIRVGLRRLRSALTLFKPWITLPPALAHDLRWLVQRLGAVRDAEVLAHTTLPALSLACAGVEDLRPLQTAAADLAQRRRRKAVQALDSERYQGLLTGLQRWLKRRGWRAESPRHEELGMPLEAAAQAMLALRSQKLSQQIRSLPDPARAEDLHRLRIGVKKIRYAHVFFQSFAIARAAGQPTQLSALQDLLGQFNDADVGRELLLHLDPKQGRPAAFASGVLWAQSQQRMHMVTALLPAFVAGPPPP